MNVYIRTIKIVVLPNGSTVARPLLAFISSSERNHLRRDRWNVRSVRG